MAWLDPVKDALDDAPAPVRVFFRDDDAGWRDDRLLALLDVFEASALPVDLAVIPAALSQELARELRARAGSHLGLHQHGFSHTNHEPEGRKHEFGPARPPHVQAEDIAAGADRLGDLLGDALDPFFTPPWNRCTAATGEALERQGFKVLSREARAEPLRIAGLRELPVHVDWCRVRDGARATPDEIAAMVAAALRLPGESPRGVMFHHAVMDRRDRERAGELLMLLAAHPRARPGRMRSFADCC